MDEVVELPSHEEYMNEMGQRLIIQTPDGVHLVARFSPNHETSKTLILVPMVGSGMISYHDFIQDAKAEGFGTIVFDLRGQGESTSTVTGKALSIHDFKMGPDGEWQKLSDDIATVAAFVRQNGGVVAGLVGASASANAALIAASRDSAIPRIVLLSPSDDYLGIKPVEAARRLGRRQLLLFIEGDHDKVSSSTEVIAREAQLGGAIVSRGKEPFRLHGTTMLDAKNRGTIAHWLATGMLEGHESHEGHAH